MSNITAQVFRVKGQLPFVQLVRPSDIKSGETETVIVVDTLTIDQAHRLSRSLNDANAQIRREDPVAKAYKIDSYRSGAGHMIKEAARLTEQADELQAELDALLAADPLKSGETG